MIKYTARLGYYAKINNASVYPSGDLSNTINTLDGQKFVSSTSSDANGKIGKPFSDGSNEKSFIFGYHLWRANGIELATDKNGNEVECYNFTSTYRLLSSSIDSSLSVSRMLVTNIEICVGETDTGELIFENLNNITKCFYTYQIFYSAAEVSVEIYSHFPVATTDTTDSYIADYLMYPNPIRVTLWNAPIVISLSTERIADRISIVFDQESGVRPESVHINGVDYAVDGYTFEHSIPPAKSHSIRINNLNKPNSKLVIKGIECADQIAIDYTRLIHLSAEKVYRSDFNKPSFGIVSSSGDLSFLDENKTILGQINRGQQCVFRVENTETLSIYNFAELLVSELDYDNYNRTTKIKLIDELIEWQNIYVEGFSYKTDAPTEILQNRTAADLYKWLYDKTPEKYNMQSFAELDDATSDILTNTLIKYPYLNGASLWAQWNKLCQLCGLYICKGNNSKTICKYTMGR